jgi:hypothetical protein
MPLGQVLRGLIAPLVGRDARTANDDALAGPPAGKESQRSQVEAVWTPKGFRLIPPERESDSEGDEGHRQVEEGRAGYGGTDTSPPGMGYGVGRTYD